MTLRAHTRALSENTPTQDVTLDQSTCTEPCSCRLAGASCFLRDVLLDRALREAVVLPPLPDPVEKAQKAQRRADASRAAAKAFRRIGERDGFRCRVCGLDRTLTVDHIIAVDNGGTDDDENFQLLCRSHNSIKGTS
jgi:5-methylcytosine-specific restriction endonuclease McrA